MSRKVLPPPPPAVAAASKSLKQPAPRLFQRRRSTSSSSDDRCVATPPPPLNASAKATAPPRATANARVDRRAKRAARRTRRSATSPAPRSNRDDDDETVANIEKWLKTRTESVSSMELDANKSEVEEGVERYLGDELPHAFLGKDGDALSIDIDLSDKKLGLAYDPILQELRGEKLLDEKDVDFILPEFRLDQLDPLALSPDVMMVAGEILPSTSVARGAAEGGVAARGSDSESAGRDAIKVEEGAAVEAKPIVGVGKNRGDESPGNLGRGARGANVARSSERPRQRRKLEPRIIKRRRKAVAVAPPRQEERAAAKEGVMAVVAISTDKIANLTQIVINTGKEEQVYQGKTSELIEATGSFPKIETGGSWSGSAAEGCSVASSNQHELVISNALEELGITDDHLQPASANESGKVWLCPREECSRQFNRLYALKGHLLAHYGVRPFKCDFDGCAWAFYSEFKLKRHKETHLKRKDYICKVQCCNRRFTTVYNLWSHEKLHSRPSRVVCHVPDCHEKFQTKRALEHHMKSHDQSHAPYVCKQEGCGKRYYSSNALTSHQRCHSYKETDVKCSWPGCGKLFDKPCRLKAHVRLHTGCKPYACTYQGCQWAFSSSSKLKRHQKKHTNERKFVCDAEACGKAFMRSEHLREHRLTHEEGRYFQCCVCDASFSAKSSLYVHIKKHQARAEAEAGERGNCRGARARGKNPTKEGGDAPSRGKVPIDERAEVPAESKVGLVRCFEEDRAEDESRASSDAGMDYILYTTPAQPDQQMIMVAPCDALILSAVSPEIEANLSSAEMAPQSVAFREPSYADEPAKRDQGSARTGLTCADVWRLKANAAVVGATDVVLGAAGLGEGLLLTEELPSMYYQDDIVGAECQVLLLDSGPTEGAIGLRDLE